MEESPGKASQKVSQKPIHHFKKFTQHTRGIYQAIIRIDSEHYQPLFPVQFYSQFPKRVKQIMFSLDLAMANDRFAWCAVTHAVTCQAMQASVLYVRFMLVCWQCKRVIETSVGCVRGVGDVVPGDTMSRRCCRARRCKRVFHAGVSSKRLICSVFG